MFKETDFPINVYRSVEKLLIYHSPKQIIDLTWSKDPKGEHEWKWFLSFFNGYIPKMDIGISVIFDSHFWQVYDLLTLYLYPWNVRTEPLINELQDMTRVHMALKVSKTLYQLVDKYKKIPRFQMPEEISKHKVVTCDFT